MKIIEFVEFIKISKKIIKFVFFFFIVQYILEIDDLKIELKIGGMNK